MKIAFIMDPIESMKLEKDTSFMLMAAACQRGHKVIHLLQSDIEFLEDQLIGEGEQILAEAGENKQVKALGKEMVDLSTLDYIWIRQDPPFDRTYFYTTLLLDHLPNTVKIINSPIGLRQCNEKLSALFFSSFTPKTLVTSKTSRILEFLKQKRKIVIKPIDGFGGKNILFINSDQNDSNDLIETATHGQTHKVIVNEYLSEAKEGDKRVLLVNGEPIGAILRKAPEGGQLHNLDQGGQAFPSELSESNKKVCQQLKPFLLKWGLYFVGIDFLGDYLTEINVTSPTGLQELIRFSKIDHHIEIIKGLEARLC